MVELDFLVLIAVYGLHVALIPRDQVCILCIHEFAVFFHHAPAVCIAVYFQPVLEPDVLAPAFRVFIHADDREVLHILGRQVVVKYFLDNVVILVYTVVHPSFVGCRICSHQQVAAVRHTLVVALGRIVVPAVLCMVKDKSRDIA